LAETLFKLTTKTPSSTKVFLVFLGVFETWWLTFEPFQTIS